MQQPKKFKYRKQMKQSRKLFGTELYSNRAVLQATGWRPRRRFSATARELMGAVKEGVG